MKLGDVFEPGNRKTTMTVLALIGTILLEKYGGGISGDLKEMILAILAIFTGGNVLSKGIRAMEEVKIAKYATPEPQDPGPSLPPEQQAEQTAPEVNMGHINKIVDHVNNLDKVAGQEITALKEGQEKLSSDIAALSDRVDTQVQNLSKVLTIVNGLRNGQVPTT